MVKTSTKLLYIVPDEPYSMSNKKIWIRWGLTIVTFPALPNLDFNQILQEGTHVVDNLLLNRASRNSAMERLRHWSEHKKVDALQEIEWELTRSGSCNAI